MFVDTTWTKDRVLVEIPDWMSQPAITTFRSTERILTDGSTIIFGDLPSFEVWSNRSVEPAPLSSYMELFQ